MFRDDNFASQERRIAELEEELSRVKAGNQENLKKLQTAQEKQRKAQEALRKERTKRIPKGTFRDRLPSLPKLRWSFPLPFTIAAMFVLACFCFVGYHYFTDIQEGVVTGTEYHPPHTDCTTDSDGHTSCTTHPESWSVDIGLAGRSASWPISHEEYRQLRLGQWYCYTDLFHSEDDCHGPPH